jgi:FixJ family two-component response regulator
VSGDTLTRGSHAVGDALDLEGGQRTLVRTFEGFSQEKYASTTSKFIGCLAFGRPEVRADAKVCFIIDDDPLIRDALSELVVPLGMRPIGFGSATEYLAFPRPDVEACLIVDFELPDANGLDFQKRIAGETHPPIIFITDHGDIPSSVLAIRLGAIDFLTKPLRETDLLRAIHAALDRDRTWRSEQAHRARLQQRLSALTPREREVLPLVVSGLLNKQAAAELGISEITYQIHRSNVMRKMQAASLADLVRIAEKLQIPVTHSRRRECLGMMGVFRR